jgi:hypothetical protein
MTGGAAYSAYLQYPVTDVLVLDDRVYFAQGYDQTTGGFIVRFRHNVSSGNLTSAFQNENTRARFLMMNIANGAKRIWATPGGMT